MKPERRVPDVLPKPTPGAFLVGGCEIRPASERRPLNLAAMFAQPITIIAIVATDVVKKVKSYENFFKYGSHGRPSNFLPLRPLPLFSSLETSNYCYCCVCDCFCGLCVSFMLSNFSFRSSLSFSFIIN